MIKHQFKSGRKTVMTEIVLGKLEYAFSMGCTDLEACLHADIHPDTLYEYQRKNPEFSERKKLLKSKLILKARETIARNMDDVKIAKWFLEKTLPYEFGSKAGLIQSKEISEELTEEERTALEELFRINNIIFDGEFEKKTI